MAKAQVQDRLSLSGCDWHIHEDAAGAGIEEGLYEAAVSAPGWLPARVPGNVQADLEAAQQLRPLWYGAGDPRLADVAQKDWWYRHDFTVPESFTGRRLQLVFDGVDYACQVWLNGQYLGKNAGMFRRFAFDVGEVINVGGANRLGVLIERMPPELAHILAASDGAMSGGGENYPREWGDDFFVHGINQTRQLLQDLKSPTNYGWDWGVNVYTLGIWQDVRLEASGVARIEWLQVLTELDDDGAAAKIRARLEINSQNAADIRASVRIEGHGNPVAAQLDTSLQPGDNLVEAELVLEQPALWWPNGQGDQPLYTLEARLEDADSGDMLDRRSTRFGVRAIRWEQVEGAPADFINPYQLVFNGRPIRMLGSNILPPDLLFGRMNERGLRLIRQAQQAGMNTLRVWGGGAFLTEEMFSLADELGIMLSQEFPMSSCSPETDAVFLENLERTIRQLVKRYRNHPCIIEWTGGNEMWWAQGDDHPALHLLDGIVAEEDDRLFRATCPIQGARHSPWHYDPETHYAHYDNEDLRDTGIRREENKMMRYGEFGCHSLAHLEVWQREIPPALHWPAYDEDDPILIRKNVVQAVFSKEHWLLKSILEGLFGEIGTLEALVEAGQYLGAHGLRYAVDALRRRGRGIGGITTWVLNEPWPNGGGPYLVDYDGRPLMIYDFLKDALAPVSLSLRYASNVIDPAVGLDAELWLVSDAPEPCHDLRWRWLARDISGTVLAQDAGRASIQPLEALPLGAIKTGSLARGGLLVELQLTGRDGAILSERAHLFGSAEAPAPLAIFLPRVAEGDQALKRTNLRAVVLSHQSDGEGDSMQIEVSNLGDMTALFCEPHPLLAYRTDINIDGNHACIAPGETRLMTISAPPDSWAGLSLLQTGWRLSCWNADDALIPPSDDVLFSIGRRDATTCGYPGYDDLSPIDDMPEIVLEGNRPDPAGLPLLMTSARGLRFGFNVVRGWDRPARLRLHTADQDSACAPVLAVTINGRVFEGVLKPGLGIQNADPAHLAFPQTLVIDLPAATLKEGRNTLELRISNTSWFSWDSIDLTTGPVS
ncbi:MAG: beta galactosidase jelly roll domain-containing protein [Chloroflexi bacterium]|nr:beta galactosidase jelly roll domain-containing protein [Chloroflexota bacterium]